MSEIKVNSISSLNGANGPVISGIATMSSSGAMTLPRGDTAYRGGRGRGVFGGGYGAASPWPDINTIDYVTIATLGNATDFGDLTVKRSGKTGGSSATRGVFISGRFPGGNPAAANVMDYVEIQSTGNAMDFGDLHTTDNPNQKAASNQIRSVFAGGYKLSTPNQWQSTIGYFNIATKGNSSSFGSLEVPGRKLYTGSNGTRGIYAGNRGNAPGSPSTNTNHIEYVTLMTTGNAQDFGDLIVMRTQSNGSMTSSTRMVMQGGIDPSAVNTIDYISMASLGDSIDFGDVSTTMRELSSSTSSLTRGVFTTGSTQPSAQANNAIEYITITTLGNSADFGDLTRQSGVAGSFSDSHGGIG